MISLIMPPKDQARLRAARRSSQTSAGGRWPCQQLVAWPAGAEAALPHHGVHTACNWLMRAAAQARHWLRLLPRTRPAAPRSAPHRRCRALARPLQISRVQKMLGDEYGTASNIKSRVNRLSVLSAITSAQQRLKLYTKVRPPRTWALHKRAGGAATGALGRLARPRLGRGCRRHTAWGRSAHGSSSPASPAQQAWGPAQPQVKRRAPRPRSSALPLPPHPGASSPSSTHQVPPNGLVLYTGTILTEDGKEKKVNIDFEPFKPINTSLYLCDNKFHTEALAELLESDNRWGLRMGGWEVGRGGGGLGAGRTDRTGQVKVELSGWSEVGCGGSLRPQLTHAPPLPRYRPKGTASS